MYIFYWFEYNLIFVLFIFIFAVVPMFGRLLLLLCLCLVGYWIGIIIIK